MSSPNKAVPDYNDAGEVPTTSIFFVRLLALVMNQKRLPPISC